MMRYFMVLLLLLSLAGSALSGPSATQLKPVANIFLPLQSWLLEQGLPAGRVNGWLSANGVRFEGKILSGMLAHKEVTRDYESFFTKASIKRAQDFKNKYQKILQQVEEDTRVPAGVIVAILLVESNLGSYTGKTPAFNVLASQAVLDSALARETLAKTWPPSQKSYLDTPAALERFAKRAVWAREEVLALIRLAEQWQVSPLTVKGSAAGAMGWCQFMPTSIEKWGADASGDNRVDLNNPLDAIASVGRYLAEHGWVKGLERGQQLEVILTYNKSTPYAEAILKLAAKL